MAKAESGGSASIDLGAGVDVSALGDGGILAGRVGDDDIVLVRSGDEFFAVAGHCTHYGAALAEGCVAGATLRCPLHHACFDLRTGEAARAPALDPLARWRVERQGGRVFVREKLEAPRRGATVGSRASHPDSIVIVGGGAAGLAAADAARRAGYEGPLALVDAEEEPPIDRPNLSKGFLAGGMPEEWMYLRPPDFYEGLDIELVLGARVSSIDVAGRRVTLDRGGPRSYGALLLAPGAEPVRLPIPGADDPRVHYLRSFRDGRALVEKASASRRAVVVGGSFIGMEVAAALRTRGLEVHVVAPESVPLERVLGREIGAYVRRLHESHGVVFHLGDTVTRVDARSVALRSGASLEAELVVMGVGVRPSVGLAEAAGLTLDRGILVDACLRTSAPGVYAAGDVARWPDRRSGRRIRVEHWVVAARQGQVAARNMLGHREPFDAVPFFWSEHYDAVIRYVGHAETWDSVRIDGDLDGDAGWSVSYFEAGKRVAIATLSRDRESLAAELAMEAEALPPIGP